MIILSFFFRGGWHYGVIKNPPSLENIGYDGFNHQSKVIFDLFLDSRRSNVPVERKCSPAREREIRSKYEGDGHYSSLDVDNIVKAEKVKSSYGITQNLFLQVRAVYSCADGWQYETQYGESDVISKKYHNNGEGVECFWFENIENVIGFLNEEE